MTREEKVQLLLDLVDLVWEEVYAPRIAAAEAEAVA